VNEHKALEKPMTEKPKTHDPELMTRHDITRKSL